MQSSHTHTQITDNIPCYTIDDSCYSTITTTVFPLICHHPPASLEHASHRNCLGVPYEMTERTFLLDRLLLLALPSLDLLVVVAVCLLPSGAVDDYRNSIVAGSSRTGTVKAPGNIGQQYWAFQMATNSVKLSSRNSLLALTQTTFSARWQGPTSDQRRVSGQRQGMANRTKTRREKAGK